MTTAYGSLLPPEPSSHSPAPLIGSWQIARGRARAAAAAVEQSAQLPPVPAPVSLDEATDMVDRARDLAASLHAELLKVRAERDGLIVALERLTPTATPARSTLDGEQPCDRCHHPFTPRGGGKGARAKYCDACKALNRNDYNAAYLLRHRQKDAKEAKRLGLSIRAFSARRRQDKLVERRFPKGVPA